MKLDYTVRKTEDFNKSIEVENEDFIPVEHRVDGRTMITAFIGKGEANNEKLSITISPSGGILDIKRMAGDALFNAENLLKIDDFNNVVSVSYFKNLYKKQKERLAVDL
jgi:hypothetical protein